MPRPERGISSTPTSCHQAVSLPTELLVGTFRHLLSSLDNDSADYLELNRLLASTCCQWKRAADLLTRQALHFLTPAAMKRAADVFDGAPQRAKIYRTLVIDLDRSLSKESGWNEPAVVMDLERILVHWCISILWTSAYTALTIAQHSSQHASHVFIHSSVPFAPMCVVALTFLVVFSDASQRFMRVLQRNTSITCMRALARRQGEPYWTTPQLDILFGFLPDIDELDVHLSATSHVGYPYVRIPNFRRMGIRLGIPSDETAEAVLGTLLWLGANTVRLTDLSIDVATRHISVIFAFIFRHTQTLRNLHVRHLDHQNDVDTLYKVLFSEAALIKTAYVNDDWNLHRFLQDRISHVAEVMDVAGPLNAALGRWTPKEPIMMKLVAGIKGVENGGEG